MLLAFRAVSQPIQMMTSSPASPRALIVEDDPVVARAVARRLLREGYQITIAGSCRGARAAGRGFVVAVLDLDLPDGGGAELAETLLGLGAVHSVIFYTGSMDPAMRQRATSIGLVLDKTRGIEELVAALEELPLEPPQSQQQPSTVPRPRTSGARLRVNDDEAVSSRKTSSR